MYLEVYKNLITTKYQVRSYKI